MHSGIDIGFGNSRCSRDKSRKTRIVILFHTDKGPEYEKICNNTGLAQHPHISHTTKEHTYG